MNSLEAKKRFGLWILEIGLGATALFFLTMSLIHSFISVDQSVSRGELDLGCMAGLAAIALGGLLLTTRKR